MEYQLLCLHVCVFVCVFVVNTGMVVFVVGMMVISLLGKGCQFYTCMVDVQY